MNKVTLLLILSCLIVLSSHLWAAALTAQDCTTGAHDEDLSDQTDYYYKTQTTIIPGKMTKAGFTTCGTLIGDSTNEQLDRLEFLLGSSAIDLANDLNKEVRYEVTCVHKQDHASMLDREAFQRMYNRPESFLLANAEIRQSFQKVHEWLYSNCNGYTISLAYPDAQYPSFRIEGRVKEPHLPKMPVLISPQNGQGFKFCCDQSMKVELQWRDVRDAIKYHVQVSETPIFVKVYSENDNLTHNSIPIVIDKSNRKRFFWRVRSIDKNNNKSDWSEPFQFMAYNGGQSGEHKPPTLKIAAVHPFWPYVEVQGKTEPVVFLTLNGQTINIEEDGSFRFTYLLQHDGRNVLKFVAKNPEGDSTVISKEVEW